MYFQKFRLPPPSSDFLADIIGLQRKKKIGDLSKTMEGMAVFWFDDSLILKDTVDMLTSRFISQVYSCKQQNSILSNLNRKAFLIFFSFFFFCFLGPHPLHMEVPRLGV